MAFAIYLGGIGQADRMFECLEAALSECDPYMTRVDSEPNFEPYRADARYVTLLRRMNLLAG
jgi:hypothetical protein